MTNRGDIHRMIEIQANALGPVLHAGVAAALVAARKRGRGLKHAKYPHLVPFLMRAELREFLEVNLLPDGWVIDGDSRKMGQLLLHHEDHNLEMRLLKERRTSYPRGVPPAGQNEARRKFWVDVPLDLDLLSLEADAAARRRTEPIRLLLLWDFLTPQTLDEFTLRLVHTLSPGTYGKAVPCDLVLDVKDGGEIFNHLEFAGSPDDENFFSIEVDQEENEGGL
jgi:hypothetical protein